MTTESVTPKTYLLKSSKKKIEFDNDFVYFNNSRRDTLETESSFEHAQRLTRSEYQNILKGSYKNLVVLAGAGTSMDGSEKGKNRSRLWRELVDELTEDGLKEFCKDINYPFDQGDIEALLSQANLAKHFIGGDIEDTISKIENCIRKNCSLTLRSGSPHLKFLNKITSRKVKDPRIKIFTTNYDTLFEQAANGVFAVIDGFSYTSPRTFAGRYFDMDFVLREKSRLKNEENFVDKVFHLYKLHGSLNWERGTENKILIVENSNRPVIIYPASNKYESSYEQPYFEMMSRFQQSLRQENTLLIVVGFSFYDKHITNVIKEAVIQNSAFQMLVVNFNGNNAAKTQNGIDILNENIEFFSNQDNVLVVDEKFSDFVENYPVNETYYSQGLNFLPNEPIQS